MDFPRARDTAHTLLLNALIQSAVDEIDLPHIVVCEDLSDGHRTYSGPYPDLAAALVGAAAEDTELNATLAPGERGWAFTVAPVHPPHPSTQVDPRSATETTATVPVGR